MTGRTTVSDVDGVVDLALARLRERCRKAEAEVERLRDVCRGQDEMYEEIVWQLRGGYDEDAEVYAQPIEQRDDGTLDLPLTVHLLLMRARDAEEDRDRYREALNTIQRRHVEGSGGNEGWCVEDGLAWPCTTARIVLKALAQEDDQ